MRLQPERGDVYCAGDGEKWVGTVKDYTSELW